MVYDSRLWYKSYDPGVARRVEREFETFPECFEKTRADFGNKPALHFLGVTLTFDQLMEQSARFAGCLGDHGLGKGDVVAISLPNSPQYLIGLVGALQAGCAVSGLSPLLSADEMAHQLTDSGAKCLLIMDALFQHRLAGVSDRVTDLELVIPTGLLDFLPKYKQLLAKWFKKVPTGKIAPLPGKKVLPFMEVLDRYPAQKPDIELTVEDPCFLQYTGGTTGLPKGAVCPHRCMLTNLAQWREWLQIRRGEDLLISAFPMFHVAGLFTAMCGLGFGVTQVLIPNPRDTKHMTSEMAKYRPQWLANVPSLYLMLLQEPGFSALDFSELKYCVSGAAAFPVEGIKQFEEIVGTGKVIELYGMTETCVVVTSNPRDGVKKVGSVGITFPSTKIKIMDLQTGEAEVPLGEEGEIIAAGPQIMAKYHEKPDETALALREHDGDVWMHTGDIGRMDEDGYLFVVDRAKDMISVGGFKVFPREIEEKLFELPAIEVCAAIGAPNPERPETEIVKLVVQKSADHANRPDEEIKKEIIAYSREHFAPYKVPKIVEFRDVPLTAAGKVDKKLLR